MDATNGNNNGSSLVELARQVEATKTAAKDYVVRKDSIHAALVDAKPMVVIDNVPEVGQLVAHPTNYFLKQSESKNGIPQDYAAWVRETNPDLYVKMFNHGMEHGSETRMIRTLQTPGLTPIVRADLGVRFNPIDNYDVLHRALPVLRDFNAWILAAECSDSKMYVKALLKKDYALEGRVSNTMGLQRGDILNRGVIIRNSEVGAGAFSVEPFVLRLSCMNGLVGPSVLRKVHIGRKMDVGEIFSQNTRDLEAQTIFSQIGDIIATTFEDTAFDKWMEQMNLAAKTEVTKPVEAIKYIQVEYKMDKKAQEELMNYFSTDQLAGPTVWGLVNAVTAYAKSQPLDRRVELEEAANGILTDQKLLKVIC
jgi:hypothetical protein